MPPAATATERSSRNSLLRALGDGCDLLPLAEPVALERGRVLTDVGDATRLVWFPHNAVLSVTVPTREGGSAEAATIGREGMVGFIAAFGDRQAFTRTVVQVSGMAATLPLERLDRAFERDPRVRDICLRYTQCLIAQVLQSVGCNALHTAEQRLARWLLMLRDRAGSDRLSLTQDFLGGMLGVRRATVALALRALRQAKIVEVGRGWIRIVDGARLMAASCECYEIVSGHYTRILPQTFR